MAIKITLTNMIEEMIDKKQEETGMTKSWLARQLGISRQALNILIRTPNPTVESLIKVSHVLQCKIDDLIYYEVHIIEDE